MTATTLLFRDDAYATSCEATILGITPEGGIVLDRTIFYAQGGGQPGDVGALVDVERERESRSTNTVYGADRSQVAHLVGAEAASRLDGGRDGRRCSSTGRGGFKRMRVHTALHLLSVVLPYPVTGGSIGDGDGRLDFDIPGCGPRQGRGHREAERADRPRRARDRALDHRRGARRQSGPREDHVGEAAARLGPRAPRRDRGHRPAALRRHPCAPHRRDRRRRRSPTSRRRASRTAASALSLVD